MADIRNIFNAERTAQNRTVQQIAYELGIGERALFGAVTYPENLTIRGLARIMAILRADVSVTRVSGREAGTSPSHSETP
jgi:hypothetical protein